MLNDNKDYSSFKRRTPEKPVCPHCGAELKEVVGCFGEVTYDGLSCPNGCNLQYEFGMGV